MFTPISLHNKPLCHPGVDPETRWGSHVFMTTITADPDGLMVVINTCDPHLVSGSTPRVAQWLIMEYKKKLVKNDAEYVAGV